MRLCGLFLLLVTFIITITTVQAADETDHIIIQPVGGQHSPSSSNPMLLIQAPLQSETVKPSRNNRQQLFTLAKVDTKIQTLDELDQDILYQAIGKWNVHKIQLKFQKAQLTQTEIEHLIKLKQHSLKTQKTQDPTFSTGSTP